MLFRSPPRIKVGEAMELFASFYEDPVDSDTLLTELVTNDILDQLNQGHLDAAVISTDVPLQRIKQERAKKIQVL